MVCSLVSICFVSLTLTSNKTEVYKALDYWSRDILNFNYLEKGLGIVSPPHFVYELSKKIVSNAVFN